MKLVATTLTCPVCDASFGSSLVVDFQIGEKESDFCPRYLDGNPLPQLLHLCPGCGYTGFEPDFRPLDDGELRATIKMVLDRLDAPAAGHAVSGPERFRRAALLAVYKKRPAAEIANLYLQATWCSRLDGEDDEQERRSRRKALEYFEKAVEAGEFEDCDLPVVYYLMGELQRRLGREADALMAFARLDEFVDVDPWLIEWRDRQRNAMRQGGAAGSAPGELTP